MKKENVNGKKGKGCLVVIGVVVALGVLGSCFGGTSDSVSETTTATATIAAVSESNEAITSEASTEANTTEANIPTEYKSALKKADVYANTMHFSKAKLYDQLTSEYGEKFSAEAAQYAVDNVVSDWNANALASAQNYSDTMHFSKARLYDQLTSEYGDSFTSEEAQYAVDNVEADWNANALATAKNYQPYTRAFFACHHDRGSKHAIDFLHYMQVDKMRQNKD